MIELRRLFNDAKLPSPAPVVLTLYARLERGSADEIAQVIESDPGLAARVLRLANSAFYGRMSVASVRDAIVRVGTIDVAALVLASEVMQVFRGIPRERLNLQQFWEHSLLVACYAQTLAPARRKSSVAPVWLCGLLHDIGKLALVRHCPTEYSGVLARVDAGASLLDAEQAVFGCTHAAVGGALLRAWRLPEELAACALRHHDAYRLRDSQWAIVAAGNDLANDEADIRGRLDMSADDVAALQQEAGALYDAYRQLFGGHLR